MSRLGNFLNFLGICFIFADLKNGRKDGVGWRSIGCAVLSPVEKKVCFWRNLFGSIERNMFEKIWVFFNFLQDIGIVKEKSVSVVLLAGGNGKRMGVYVSFFLSFFFLYLTFFDLF